MDVCTWGGKGGWVADTDSGEEEKVLSESSFVAWETGLLVALQVSLGTPASRPVSQKVVCDLEPVTHHVAGLRFFICKKEVADPGSFVILC